MNTPITNKHAFSVCPWHGHYVLSAKGNCVDSATARRLELDRSIFRQALIDIYLAPAADSRALANAALQAASKFEGEEHAP